MSLGGIAIAIGALVDAAIVVVEQTHKKLEQWERERAQRGLRRRGPRARSRRSARPSFFALLVIAVSFLPVLTLEAQEGRLFRPLAYTKNLRMVVAAILAITLDPALRLMFTRLRPFTFQPRVARRLANAVAVGKIHPRRRTRSAGPHPPVSSRSAAWSLRRKWVVIGAALALVLVTDPDL